MTEFVALWSRDPAQLATLGAQIRAFAPGWRVLEAAGPHLIAVNGPALAQQGLVIIGEIFNAADFVVTRDADTAGQLADERGRRIVTHGWGHYVAFLLGADGTLEIIRSPFGRLGCIRATTGDAIVVASSVALIDRLVPSARAISLPDLAQHLAFPYLSRAATCREGLIELRGGQRWTIYPTGVIRETQIWSPWDHVHTTARDRSDQALAATIRQVVAQMVPDGPVLLKLSGGLDSSIIAAALAEIGRPLSALTLVTDDPGGDERTEARRVAAYLRIPLAEARRDPASIDLGLSPARTLARPAIPLFRQVSDGLSRSAALASDARAIVDGGGGDNVFCALRSVAPVIDCLRRPTGWPYLTATATSIALLASASLPAVARATIRRLGRRRDHLAWPRDTALLNRDIADALPLRPAHPWLHIPSGVAPGRAAHVGLMIAAQSYVENMPATDIPLVSPLLAQPLIEHCLSVPSWCWFEDGHDRAAARRAFADALPHATVWRRSKGSPDAFVAQIFEHHRHMIAGRLLDGGLARRGLFDRAALGEVLGNPRPLEARMLARIMALVDAELWAEHQSG